MLACEFGLEPLRVACEVVPEGKIVTGVLVMNEIRRMAAPSTPIPLRGILPVMAQRSNAKNARRWFLKQLYKTLAALEQAMGKLKQFKRIALRHEKTAVRFYAFADFACALTLLKSVFTA